MTTHFNAFRQEMRKRFNNWTTREAIDEFVQKQYSLILRYGELYCAEKPRLVSDEAMGAWFIAGMEVR